MTSLFQNLNIFLTMQDFTGVVKSVYVRKTVRSTKEEQTPHVKLCVIYTFPSLPDDELAEEASSGVKSWSLSVSHAIGVVRWSILWILNNYVTLFFPGYVDVIWINHIGILRHIWPSNVLRNLVHVGARTILKDIEKHGVIWMSSMPIFYHQSNLKVYSDFNVWKY